MKDLKELLMNESISENNECWDELKKAGASEDVIYEFKRMNKTRTDNTPAIFDIINLVIAMYKDLKK